MDWTTFLSSTAVSTVLMALLIFLGRKWLGTRIEEAIKLEYSKDLESHKAKLSEETTSFLESQRHEYSKDLEVHKSNLQEQMAQSLRAMESEQERAKIDQKLFDELLTTLPTKGGSIEKIRNRSLASAFKSDWLNDFRKFLESWNDPEHEFLDTELEAKRKVLYKSVNDFFDEIGKSVCRVKGMDKDHLIAIPEEWEYEQPDRFRTARETLDKLANEVIEAHEDLIRIARQKLIC